MVLLTTLVERFGFSRMLDFLVLIFGKVGLVQPLKRANIAYRQDLDTAWAQTSSQTMQSVGRLINLI